MKLLSFTYTKPTGEVSERLMLVVSEPNTLYKGWELREPLYKGWELRELEIPEAIKLSEELSELAIAYKEAQIKLLKQYDAQFSFRSYTPSNMTRIEEI